MIKNDLNKELETIISLLSNKPYVKFRFLFIISLNLFLFGRFGAVAQTKQQDSINFTGIKGLNAGYAYVSDMYGGNAFNGRKSYVANNILGPIYFPSYNLYAFPYAFSVNIKVTSTFAGKYYLNLKSEPPLPWNPFFETAAYNYSTAVNMIAYSDYTFQMGVVCPSSSAYPTQYLVLEVKEATGGDPVHESKNIQLIVDTDPPDTYVIQGPTTTTSNSFLVNWTGVDKGSTFASNGPSGVWKYDVQYRENNGSWQDWKMGTPETSSIFTGISGNTYYFQCRGYDNVGNVETYPGGNGDAFISIQYLISTSSSPSIGGTASGSGPYNPGSTATVTALPAPSHLFVNWTENGNVQYLGSSYSFPVTSNRSLVANFLIKMYIINATVGIGGTISPAGDILVDYGSNKDYSITPDAGYQIDYVTVDGVNQGAINSYTFPNVISGHTIAAYFKIKTNTISATASTGGSISPSGNVVVNSGSNQSFAISANTGYQIDYVIVDGANQGAIGSYTFPTVTSSHTIAAYFKINNYIISATAGTGGSISPSGNVAINSGATQSFTITANAGYRIDHVTVDEANQGAIDSYTFPNVNSNHTISSYFSAISNYTIIATALTGGTISPSGNVLVTQGSNQVFTITPNVGYDISYVTVDGANQGAINSYTFPNVAAGHTIIAYFVTKTCTLNATAGVGGYISPSGNFSFSYGSTYSFTITPNPGYQIDYVTVDGGNQGAISNYEFNNITSNHTISAYFKTIASYTISATAGTGGSISPSGIVVVNSGSNQSFTISPNIGYQIDYVTVDGANQGPISSYTFNNVTVGHTISAYFKIMTYMMSATAGEGGTISPSGNILVNYGSSLVFNITPNPGYQIDYVLINNENYGAINNYTIENVTYGRTILAYFKLISTTKTLSVFPDVSWDYGIVTTGNVIDKIFLLQNSGTNTLSITNLALAGANADQFAIISPTNTTFDIVAGGSQLVTVRFKPTTVGGKYATLTITNNSDNSGPAKSISLTGTGYTLPSKTWVVSSIGGSDLLGNGTEGFPFQTIQHAINQAGSNDIVFVHKGTYYENITLKSYIYVRSEDNLNTYIVGKALTSGVVNFNTVINSTLDGFKITVDIKIPGVDRGVAFSYCDNTVLLKNCIIYGVQYGIFITAASNPMILNNTIVGNNTDDDGIYIDNSPNQQTIIDNIITGYKIGGITVFNGNPNIRYNNVWNNTLNYYGYNDQTGLNGNISQDPLFLNSTNFDFSLKCGSPCINSGDPSLPMDAENSRPEIGAITFTSEAPSAPAFITSMGTCSELGTITVYSPIGTGITYSINGSDYTNTSGIFTSLAAGSYTVTAKSSAGCISPGISVTIPPQPTTPTAPITNLIQPTCSLSTGTITITSPQGSGTIYTIFGPGYMDSNTTGVFTSLAVGTYTVIAKSSDGCVSPGTSVTINPQPNTPSAPVTTLAQPTCSVATGTITVISPTGSGMTYSINGSNYTNTSGVFTLVPKGTYMVTARSSAGCISTGTSATINPQPVTPTAPITNLTHPTCSVPIGTITITSPTGTGMTYSINGSDYSNTTGVFMSVPAGSYTVTARSSAGCISIGASVTINAQPIAPPAPITNLIQPSCSVATGAITVISPTGSGMTYSINGSNYTNTSGVFTPVPVGTYMVTARSSAGCISNGTSVTINLQPITPTAPLTTLSQPTCSVATGAITVISPTGSGMTYSINGSNYTNTSGVFTPVPVGTYMVTARSSAGCISTGTSVTINPQPITPTSPMITLAQPTCSVSTGTITVTTPTGSGLAYSIKGSDFTNTTGVFNTVPSGTYMVTVRSSTGCVSTGTSVTINPPPITPTPPLTSLIQPTCSVSTGSIMVTSPTGSGMTYSMNGSDYSNTTGVFTLVPGGTYRVTARNSAGCLSNGTSVTINLQPVSPTSPITTLTQPTCSVPIGTITITSPTGSGMTFSINGSNFTNTTGVFTPVSVGTYTVTARSSAGCISTGTSVTINPQPITPTAPMITLTQPTCLVSTGTITIISPTGTDMTYSINSTDYSNTTGVFTSVPAGTYRVTVGSSGGCISIGTSATINGEPAPPLTPEVIQNGDILTSNSNVGNQWYTVESGLISGATDQKYTMPSNGNYYVIVTINGCASDPSNIISFPYGIEKTEFFKGISIYPNPAHDKLIIEDKKSLGAVDFEIVNPGGKVVYNSVLINKSIIDLYQFTAGFYFIRFKIENSYYILKFIKY